MTIPAAPEPDVTPERARRRGRVLGAFGLVGVVVVVAVALTWSDPPRRVRVGPARSGGQAVPFELEDVRARKHTIALADYQGRPVVLNFWASWCNPCRREMPAFQSVHEQLGPRVVIIGIDIKDIRRDARNFLRRTGVTYPAAFDLDGEIANAYAVTGLPQTIFISPKGEIVDRLIGEVTHAQLTATIEARFDIST